MSIYNIVWSSAGNQSIPGKSTITILDENYDTSTSITLLGRDVTSYGQIEQTNLIRLMEHFASDTSPINPTVGQLWFNPTANTLYVCVYPNITTVVSKPEPNAIAGTSATPDHSWWVPTNVNYVPLSSAGGTVTGNITMSNGYTVTGVPTPVNSSDAVNKSYVDSAAASLNIHAPVATATTVNLVANYEIGSVDTNGGTGLGSQLYAQSPGVLTVSGYTPVLGDRVLVKNQTTPYQNGVYTLTTVGTSTVHWTLNRATDYDDSIAETPPMVGPGDYVFVTGGSLAGTSWVQQGIGTGPNNSILIGTDPINFVLFSNPASYSAGSGLSLTGTTFSNAGVISLTGSSNIAVTGSAGNLTLSLTGTVPAATSATQATTVSATPSSANLSFYVPLTSTSNGAASIVTSTKLVFNPSTGALTSTSFVGPLTGNASTATSATTAGSLAGGSVGYVPYQSSAGNTTLLAPGANGTVLTIISGVPSWQVPPGGSGGGVTSLTGTANQIVASATTGAVTLSLPSTINVNTTGTAANITGTYTGSISSGQITTALGFTPQPFLGFTPVQQGGGISQGTNKIYIGFNISALNLQVDSTNYGSTWPISISGTSTSASVASQAATQTVGTSNNSIATTQFVQQQIAATGAVSSAYWCYTNPATLSANGYVNYQTASPDSPVGITSYSSGAVTIEFAGMYHISASTTISVNGNTVGIGQLSLYQNGSSVPSITNKWSNFAVNSSAQNYNTVSIAGLIYCSVGDIIQVSFYNNSSFGTILTGFGQFLGFKIA